MIATWVIVLGIIAAVAIVGGTLLLVHRIPKNKKDGDDK
jgi:hypothetical protein